MSDEVKDEPGPRPEPRVRLRSSPIRRAKQATHAEICEAYRQEIYEKVRRNEATREAKEPRKADA